MDKEVNTAGKPAGKAPGHIVGMDAHSRKISLCIAEWAPGSDPAVTRELTDIPLAMMEDVYRKHVPKGAVTVLEASTNAFNIVKRLRAVGYGARVAYSDILRGLSRKDKVNDRIDARKLVVAYARFGATREMVFVPSDRFAGYRDLLFGYRECVKETTRVSNRIWSFCSAHGMPLPKRKRDRKVECVKEAAEKLALDDLAKFHLDDLLSEYGHALRRREKYSRQIAGIVGRDETMRRLMQIPGVSVITAFALAAYVEDIHRFPTPAKLVAYIGLNPMVCASGETGSPDVLSSYGQRILKTYFIEVGQALVRRRTAHGIGRWARAKIAQGKPYLVMCAAAGRKAVIYAWHSMMGHPIPDRESERMFRDKLMKLYRELGTKARKTLGDKTSREYAERVMNPLYAHLEGDGTKPPPQDPASVA